MHTYKRMVLFVFFISCFVFLGAEEGEHEQITFVENDHGKTHAQKQLQLKQQQAWQQFTKQHGSWYVEFNERTALPHRAFGQPIPVSDQGSVKATALHFVRQQLKSFQLPVDQLQLQNISSTDKYYYIDFQQYHNGHAVLFSRLTLRLTKDYKVAMFGTDVFKNVTVDMALGLAEGAVSSAATKGLQGEVKGITITDDLKILPVPGEEKYNFRPVYEVKVRTQKTNDVPGNYYTLVDAKTGKIWYRQNKTRTTDLRQTINLHTHDTIYPSNTYNPTAVEPLPYAEVEANSSTFFTDLDGNLTLSNGSPTTATLFLEGKWAKVVTGTNGSSSDRSPSTTFTVSPSADTIDVDTTIQHVNAYYHTNVVHDVMKEALNGYTGLDFPFLVVVDRTDSDCNAFYDGNSINFYADGGGCYGMSQIADVVYHEYGHGISDYFYNDQGTSFQNSALGEGYSDVWGFGITENPVVGQGYQTGNPNSYIRRYDFSPKVYPDDITGEPHNDGEIIAGAWWDAGQNMGSVDTMMAIFGDHYYGLPNGPTGSEGQVYRDALLEALLADDDDADLANGTPHDQEITCAFADHGITLAVEPDSVHQVVDQAPAQQPIQIDATVSTTAPWYYDSLKLFYRDDGQATWQSKLMSNSGGTFSADIPGKSEGTVVEYYMDYTDICGKTGYFPHQVKDPVPNIPYHTLIGYQVMDQQDFDNNQGSWAVGDTIAGVSDDATTGVWEIGEPNPSYLNPTNPTDDGMVQMGTDHSSSSTDICAFTGNASTFSSAGTNDIDDGKTTLFSPVYKLRKYKDPAFGYYRYYTNDMGATPNADFWEVYITNDLGQTWKSVDSTLVSDKHWRHLAFRVKDYLTLTDSVQLKFVASDEGSGSLVEAGLDDLTLYATEPPSAIAEHNNEKVQVFPNPASTTLTLYLNELQGNDYRVSLYNVLGQQVYNKKVTKPGYHEKLSVGALERGVYLLEVKTDQTTYKQKVVLH